MAGLVEPAGDSLLVADASGWSDLSTFGTVAGSQNPMAVGRTRLSAGSTSSVVIAILQAATPPSSAAAQLAAATARTADLAARITMTTGDALLDAAASVAGASVDGLWRLNPPVFVHGAMAWDVVYVGWRSE
jgi:hypothetical protein